MAMYRNREQQRLERVAQNKKDAAPSVKELLKVGFNISHPGELYQNNLYYKEEIPILLKWLPKIKNRNVRDSIIRSFCAPWAFPVAWKPLVKTFETMQEIVDPNLRWSIGNSLKSMTF
jgi:hypothetical protein